MVPNALSDAPLRTCLVEHKQLQQGNAAHLYCQTKHRMSRMPRPLNDIAILVAAYDMHSYGESILSS